jgi:predicted Zn-dependent peptidase
MARYYKFYSGLTLLYDNNNINSSTSIDITFDCGARCDGEIAGLSHFCEHMFFTGTDKLSKQDVMDYTNHKIFVTNLLKQEKFKQYEKNLLTNKK